MKKLTLLFLGLCCSLALTAQIHKGVVLLGGTVGFNNVSSDGVSYGILNFSPSAAFFVGDRTAVGGSVNIVTTTGDLDGQTNLGISPLVRYYFNGSGTSRFFGQINLGLQSSKSEGFDATTSYLFGAGVGADFFLNDRVAIEALLNYQRVEATEGGGGYNGLGINFGVAAFIGGGKE